MLIRKQREKKSVAKREIKYEDYRNCLESNKTVLSSQKMFRRELNNVFKEKIKKITIGEIADKRIRASN